MNLVIGKFVFPIILLVGFAAVSHAQSAGAPLTYEIKFEKGVFVKKGTVQPAYPCPPDGPTECGNSNYTNLTLKAIKGERLRITLTSDTGGAVFSIHTPDNNPLENASSVKSWSGTFSSAADFPLTVYTNKSFTHYTLRVVKLN
jgi:hypothetical protein